MITYPVNVEEDRFDIYDMDLAQIVNENKRWPRADGMELEGADPTLKPLERVRGIDTPIDEQTQRYDGRDNVVDLPNETSTYTQHIRDLTQDELDARAAQQANTLEDAIATNWIPTLKSGTATNAQTQKAVAYLLERFLGL